MLERTCLIQRCLNFHGLSKEFSWKNGVPNIQPPEMADGSAFNLVRIIAHLYCGPVRLNKYFGVVNSGGIPIRREKETHLAQEIVLSISAFMIHCNAEEIFVFKFEGWGKMLANNKVPKQICSLTSGGRERRKTDEKGTFFFLG